MTAGISLHRECLNCPNSPKSFIISGRGIKANVFQNPLEFRAKWARPWFLASEIGCWIPILVGVAAESNFELGAMKAGWSAKTGCDKEIASAWVVVRCQVSTASRWPPPLRWDNMISFARLKDLENKTPQGGLQLRWQRQRPLGTHACLPLMLSPARDANTEEWPVCPIQIISSKSGPWE